MATNTYILYNNKVVPSPTPLVSLERENIYYNQYWGNSDKITLQGQTTGNGCSPFNQIATGQLNLLNIFNENFGNFQVYEATGATGFNLNVSGTFKSFSSYFNNLTGVYVPKNSTIVVKISGAYGGFPITFYRNTSLANIGNPFSLFKINYYSGASETVFPQPIPYTGFAITAPQSIPSDDKYIDPTFNAKGIYSGNIGNNNYISFASFGGGGGTPIIRLEVNSFNAEKIYENSGIIVRSINFDESPYAGIVDYTVELNSIRLSGNVTDPTNEYSFAENENKTVSLSHNVSARGINTSLNPSKSNAIDNAILFVKSNTGLANIPATKFISGQSNKFYLQNFSESIDRLNGVYTIQENYISNLLNTGLSGNLSYTLDITSGAESNSVQINLRGEYKGPKDGDINNLRNSLNITGLITGSYSGYYNPIPIQYNITENTGENLINFDYTFDNINLPNPYYKYDSSINRDELDQIYNVQVRGEIIARGNRNYRYFLSTGNLVNLTGQLISVASGILSGFKDFNSDTSVSSLRTLSISVNQNPNEGTVSAEASFDDKFMPTGNCIDASYNISITAPQWYMNNQPTCNIKGYHIINDFDITSLPKASINTSLKYKQLSGLNNESIVRQQIKDITDNIIPTSYNFNTKLQDSLSYSKKYINLQNVSEISYKLDKVDINNENSLLPKFNTIL